MQTVQRTRLEILLWIALLPAAALVGELAFLSGNQPAPEPAKAPLALSDQNQGRNGAEPSRPAEPNAAAQTSGELDEALQVALAEQDPARRKALLEQWALSIPVDAIEDRMGRIESIPDAQLQSDVRFALVSRWAGADPAAAAAMLSQRAAQSDAPPEWVDLLGMVAGQWTHADPGQAINYVQALPDGPAQAETLAQVNYQLRTQVGNLAATDPQTAAAWVRALPPGAAGASATAFLAKTWAEKDPASAAAFVNILPPGETQNQAANNLAASWALAQPVQAAAWVQQLPESSAREQALDGLMTSWAGSNPDEAAQWLQNLPPSHSRDVAISTFSGMIDNVDPETAFQWAKTIANNTLRIQQLQNVAAVWLQKNPGDAQTQITQSDLPQTIKAALLQNAAASPP